MSVYTICSSCGKRVRGLDRYAGTTVKCPGCGGDISFPEPEGPLPLPMITPTPMLPSTARRAQWWRRRAIWFWGLGGLAAALVLVFTVINVQRNHGQAGGRRQLGSGDADKDLKHVKWEWDEGREADRAVNLDAVRAVKWDVKRAMKWHAESEVRLAELREDDQDDNQAKGGLKEWAAGDVDWYAEDQRQDNRWNRIEELVNRAIFLAAEVRDHGATVVVGRPFYALPVEDQENFAGLVGDYAVVKARSLSAKVSLLDSRSGNNAGDYFFGRLSMQLGRWTGPSAEDWPLEFLSVNARPWNEDTSGSLVRYFWTMKVKNHYHKPVNVFPKILLLDKDGFIVASLRNCPEMFFAFSTVNSVFTQQRGS